MMTRHFNEDGFLTVAVPGGGSRHAHLAQGAAPTPWELKPDMGYAYGKDGKTLSYKMGTNNAGTLPERRQEGAEGHLVLRRREWTASTCGTGPYLEDDGRFKFRDELRKLFPSPLVGEAKT